jgi:hypothetical protein
MSTTQTLEWLPPQPDRSTCPFAVEVEKQLSAKHKVRLVPVSAQLPTYTEVGMASLMPEAGSSLSLAARDGNARLNRHRRVVEGCHAGAADLAILDREQRPHSAYAPAVDRAIRSIGLRVLKTPMRTPQAKAFCERPIGTIRRERLDWLIPFHERHLRGILRARGSHITIAGARMPAWAQGFPTRHRL